MKLSQMLKMWLVKNYDVDPDADDEDFRKAAGEAFAEGKLTAKMYTDMTKDVGMEQANEFNVKLDRIADGLSKMADLLTKQGEEPPKEEEKAGQPPWLKPKPKPGEEEVPAEEEEEPMEEEEEGCKKPPKGKKKSVEGTQTKKVGNIGRMLANEGEEKETDVRVKEAAEHYSTTKSAMVFPSVNRSGRPHAFAGLPVTDMGRPLESQSERDMAVIGAWGKFMCSASQKRSKTLAWMGMNDHDKELIQYAMKSMNWVGASDGGNESDIVNRRLRPHETKALIDDSTSGGTEAVPVVFDDAVITTPILQGEFAPLVNTVPLDKGRLINGVQAGTVSSSWGGVDDTAITLFSTASFVSAFDTTIYRWQGAIWIGLDFLSDTPIDFGRMLTEQYGEVLLKDLDNAICAGNGTTQPEGIMTKSGTTSVAFGGATSIGGYESLRFGVHKREHVPALMRTAVFGGTDTSYQRAMAIPVGASDARRLTSVTSLPNYDGYTWMGRPYKINESLSNSQIFYAILGRYRMYRRRGLTIRNSTEGDTLIRRNEMLIVATARYGGQLERAACAAVTSTAPA